MQIKSSSNIASQHCKEISNLNILLLLTTTLLPYMYLYLDSFVFPKVSGYYVISVYVVCNILSLLVITIVPRSIELKLRLFFIAEATQV